MRKKASKKGDPSPGTGEKMKGKTPPAPTPVPAIPKGGKKLPPWLLKKKGAVKK